ncbi:MAG: hypothetical protein KGQ49_01795 [Verrucomicrobia bacterium]|nr:hypothetical protein [Verrucomicrobiota bacterium]
MYILGIHLDKPFLQISRIRKTRKGIEVEWTKTASLKPNEEKPPHPETVSADPKPIGGPQTNVKPQYTTPKTEAVFGGPSANVKQQYTTPKTEAVFGGPQTNVKRLYIGDFKGKVVSGLSPKDFLVRSVDVKIANQKHMEKAIAFQSEALSHFKEEEVLIVPWIAKREKGKAEALLFTVPRAEMKSHLATLEQLGIDPDVVSATPSALCHFFRWKFPKLTDAFLIDLGSQEVSCVLMEKGMLKKAHAIPAGVEDLLQALYEDRKRILLKSEIEGAAKQIDLLLLKSQLNPHLSNEIHALKQEIAKIFHSFTRDALRPILFTGRSDAFIHLKEFLIDSLNEEWSLTVEEQKSAVSLGLCIEQAQNGALQLRKEEFFPRKNWVRMGRTALLLLGCSLLLSIALAVFGMQFAQTGKEEMLRAIKTPLRHTLLTEQSSETPIDQWIDAIEKSNQEYVYLSQAPKVTEVLAWLSAHPLLEELKLEGDPIDLQEIRVQLVKYPTLRSPNDPYLEKVELEFRFQSMMTARRFHEALREGDDKVNPNLEISWDVLQDGYRTSFYLKNRSPYVP